MSQSSLLVEVAACVRNEAHNSMPVQAPLNISYCYGNGLPLYLIKELLFLSSFPMPV